MAAEGKSSTYSNDFIVCMANFNEFDNVGMTVSSDDSSDEISIIKESEGNFESHRCDLCCEGEFLVDKLLRFGGLIDEKYKFVCDKCDKNFVHRSELKKHLSCCSGPVLDLKKANSILSSATQQSKPDLVCPDCYQTFKSRAGLTKHKRVKHGFITHKCEVCKEVFSSFKKFKHHCCNHVREKHFRRKKTHKADKHDECIIVN